MPELKIKRAYDPPEHSDGKRVLVDRLWPRGVSKDELKLDYWWKELAPSAELRRWFGHDPERWEEFSKRYREELAARPEDLDRLRGLSADRPVTLVYAAKDEDHNNAVVLKELVAESGSR
ncbi:MAG TPA: DUF488 domain-containing protein [Pararhizobium sp.]|nr:DUF488 domain-containing protein [Pararhizobium sp.]